MFTPGKDCVMIACTVPADGVVLTFIQASQVNTLKFPGDVNEPNCEVGASKSREPKLFDENVGELYRVTCLALDDKSYQVFPDPDYDLVFAESRQSNNPSVTIKGE